MRDVSPALAAELASGVTTLCRCWKAIRRDGTVFGFTDHDQDLSFAGVTFKAGSGLDASEAEHMLGLAVGGGEVAGALMAAVITEDDIATGLWDDARIETWVVDWRDVSRRILMDSGAVGDIRRQGDRFTAEVRSLAHQMDQPRGRRYTSLCDAELGDSRCRVDLSATNRRHDVTITLVNDAATFTVVAVSGSQAGDFTGGTVKTQSGTLIGTVMSHSRAGNHDVITLWADPRQTLVAGQIIRLTVGCDKSFETCRRRFANNLNFRGFPHIPGNDFVISYARAGDPGLDGGVLTR
jgi:uncharacterized phage protein (TIGR02218 family)